LEKIMAINGSEARHALAEIQSATDKSSALRAYAGAANYLIVWGAAWIAGGFAGLISPALSQWGWSIAVAVAIACSIVLGVRAQGAPDSSGALIKIMLMTLMMALVCAAISVVLDLPSLRAAFALQALIISGLYMGYGVWRGARIFILGFALAGAVLVGWFYLRDQFELFLGVAGGALLIITGLWLRRA
jgi:hypothetical protein